MGLTFRSAGDAALASSPVTVAFTCPAEFQQLMVVGISRVLTNAVTGITYGGQALTNLGGTNDGTAARVEIWYLKNPPTGANDLVVTIPGTPLEGVVGICVYSGVDVTDTVNNPIDSYDGVAGSVTAVAQNATNDIAHTGGVSGAPGTDIIFAVLSLILTNSAPVPAGGETQRWTRTTSATFRGYGVDQFGDADGNTNILIDTNAAVAATYALACAAIHKDPTQQISLSAVATAVMSNANQARITRSATATPVATRVLQVQARRTAIETAVATRVVQARKNALTAIETAVATRVLQVRASRSAVETPVATLTRRTTAVRTAIETAVATVARRTSITRTAIETAVATRVVQARKNALSTSTLGTATIAAVRGFLFTIIRRKVRRQLTNPPEQVL